MLGFAHTLHTRSTQIVHYGPTVTEGFSVRSVVPQGSVLGPLFYILYTADVSQLVEELRLEVMGAGTFSEECGQERKGHDSANIF